MILPPDPCIKLDNPALKIGKYLHCKKVATKITCRYRIASVGQSKPVLAQLRTRPDAYSQTRIASLASEGKAFTEPTAPRCRRSFRSRPALSPEGVCPMNPLAPTSQEMSQSRTVRVIAIVAIALGLLLVASSASARFAVAKLVNRAVAAARGSGKPKTAPSKRSSGPTQPVSLSNKAPLAKALLAQIGEATVATDKLAYQPGETVLIRGAGFSPNERVTLQVRHHDMRTEVGPAYDRWDVQVDGDGKISSSWIVDANESHGNCLEVLAKGADSGSFAMVFFTDPSSADLDQCGNGPASAPVLCTLLAWQNGNLNQNQAHYAEGDSVPYRMKFALLTVGATNTVTIS